MKIQMTDLKKQYESIKTEIDSAIKESLNECGFILGKQVSLLENTVANYSGTKYGIGVASGTDALILALAAIGIQKDDEVITTPFTFIATAEAVSRLGAKPVFCDIDPVTYNIDPKKIEAKITKKTKAIIPVHLYGLSCEMDDICAIAKKHNLKIVEDCAQSFGTEYKGKKTGSIGDCGCLSFFPAKTLGCYGDGGMIITNSEEYASRIKMLRNHGSSKKYYYGNHGYNSRLDTLHAAVLLVKMKYIDKWINKRIENAKHYNYLLSDIKTIVTPQIGNDKKHSFNYYTIRITDDSRDKLQEYLKGKEIPTMIYYPLSLHLQDVYKELKYKSGDFPVSEKTQNQVISLPMCPELDKATIETVVDSIKEFYK
jgi:hypothetical protein